MNLQTRRTDMRSTILSFLLFCVAWPALAAEEARVAVASNFTGTMQQLVQRFEQQNPYHVVASYGSTGKLFAQITNGAPFDAFLSADVESPSRLEAMGLITSGSRFTYARGELVLWSPSVRSADEVLALLKSGAFRYLAMANPKTAPYGAAAEEVLTKLGLDRRYAQQTVQGDNIAQTFQFVHSGNAQLGFVARSQMLSAEATPSGAVWEIPLEMYAPIEQQAVLLKRGAENTAARAFLDFLRSKQAREIIAASGYGIAMPSLAASTLEK
ncbi:MAG: molybdate ABC transporter substrate-binding protein [Pseudomonadota bacterium]